tara:strand:+ start:831 stop:1571 length:741 start_codon:yes stop_codon:yes gene_type:complete
MIVALIPARLKSKRLPNKPLINIENLPLIMHVYNRAKLSKKLDRVIVCADEMKIVNLVKKYGGDAIITNKNHKNGTERIQEVAKKINAKLVIDIQCDAAFIDPKEIDRLINFHKKNNHYDIVIPHSEYNTEKDNSAVKLCSDKYGKILYMSRHDIPLSFYNRKRYLQRHQDFISFKKTSLGKFSRLKKSKLENLEGIELLRALENRMNLGTYKIKDNHPVSSINNRQDLKNAKKRMRSDKIKLEYV